MKHYFQANNPDLLAISKRLVFWFKQHEYDVDSTESDGNYLIQAKKSGKLRTMLGTNIAFKIRLYLAEEPNEFVFESTTGQWTQNIAGAGVTALFTGGITLITGAAGAAWTVKVERDIVEFMESTLLFKKTRVVETKDTPQNFRQESAPQTGQNFVQPGPASAPQSPRQKAMSKVQFELNRLKNALDQGILDEQEFASKSFAIESQVDDFEVEFIVEERTAKLRAAVEDGVIDEGEFKRKIADAEISARAFVQNRGIEEHNAQLKAKLKSALENGVLTQDEYDAKIAAIG